MAIASTSSANNNATSSPLSDLKLPRMNLPIFSGNYLEWQSLFDLFEMELNYALRIYLRHIQQQHFCKDIARLQRGLPVESSSTLHQLHPFLDESGLVRVGGRLRQSDLSYDNKHPILLPTRSIFTSLVLVEEHQQNLHCGPQLLLAASRRQYWIIRGCSAARKVYRNCVTCSRVKPVQLNQQMGQLPADRLKPLPPFTITGIDYAGPVNIIGRRTRAAVPSKGYIALFVCLGTRAVHIEAVSDLSASAFLAAFTRFCCRYGVPSKMYSDNATNLRASARILRELYQEISTTEHSAAVSDFLANKRVQWVFIPARSPHQGGLWEAAIKVAKRLLGRLGNDHNYTFEELTHFLIGRSLEALPEINHLELQVGSLTRWAYVQRVSQDFRARWQNEYVLSLQRSSKWNRASPNLKAGDFVLLVDDNQKSYQWPIGRVLELFPGPDGLVRVVSVKTSKGVFRRDIRKLRRFPLDSDEFVAGRNGSEITIRNLVGGLCSHENTEPPYHLRSKVI
nr:uncharacterized protein LOC109404313 [Aedes albopictus]